MTQLKTVGTASAGSKKVSKKRRRQLEATVFGATSVDDVLRGDDDEDDPDHDEDPDQQVGEPEKPLLTAEGDAARTKAAWEDSDDEQVAVDVAGSKKRLRKLRRAEEEIEIGGRTYEARLREHFRKQNGDAVPDWAKGEDKKKKKSKTAEGEDDENTEVEEDVDHDIEEDASSDEDKTGDAAAMLRTVDFDKVQEAQAKGTKHSLFASKRDKKIGLLATRVGADNFAIAAHGKTTDGATADATSVETTTTSTARKGGRKTTSRLPVGSRGPLASNELCMTRLKNANQQAPMNCAADCVDFHPNSELLLTAGRDKTLRLFAIDGTENPKIASYHFKDFPIMHAQFLPGSGESIYLSGMGSLTMHKYDVQAGRVMPISPFRGNSMANFGRRIWGLDLAPCRVSSGGVSSYNNLCAVSGEQGKVCLIDLRSHSLARQMTMNGPAVKTLWHPDGKTLVSADSSGGIYEWDVSSGRCINSFRSEGALGISSMDIGTIKGAVELAIGTNNGTVDVFRMSSSSPSSSSNETNSSTRTSTSPLQPVDRSYSLVKTYKHLTVCATQVKFHPQYELMAFASKFDRAAMKIAHAETKTVFPNWPTMKTPFKYQTTVAFSEKNGYCALGQSNGKVLLYQLEHYAPA
ncbi:unnamed protein product [Amoebophrya sp. A25]|nr:unnamed protein product [Amoebophrya sp. A25]|eukprot:GSA25T00007903001.1